MAKHEDFPNRPSNDDLLFLIGQHLGIVDPRTGELMPRWRTRLHQPRQETVTATEMRLREGGSQAMAEHMVRQGPVPGIAGTEGMGSARVPEGVTMPTAQARFPNLEPLEDPDAETAAAVDAASGATPSGAAPSDAGTGEAATDPPPETETQPATDPPPPASGTRRSSRG